MINEASSLRIASDFVNTQIAKTMKNIRKCNDVNTKETLERNLKELIQIKKQVDMGNYNIINSIIKKVKTGI